MLKCTATPLESLWVEMFPPPETEIELDPLHIVLILNNEGTPCDS